MKTSKQLGLLYCCLIVFRSFWGAISNPVNVYMYVFVYVKTAPFDVDKKNLSCLADKFIKFIRLIFSANFWPNL